MLEGEEAQIEGRTILKVKYEPLHYVQALKDLPQ